MSAEALKSAFLAGRLALLRFLKARTRNDALAEDLLQELWLKLESGIGPAAGVDQPLAYLYSMANNLVLDSRRAEGRRIRRDETWTDLQGGEKREWDTRPSAETILLARERLAAMNRVLDALPERTAKAFRMRRVQSVPQKQIAAEIGISVSAVEKHLQRAYRAVLDAQRDFDADVVKPRRPAIERYGQDE